MISADKTFFSKGMRNIHVIKRTLYSSAELCKMLSYCHWCTTCMS